MSQITTSLLRVARTWRASCAAVAAATLVCGCSPPVPARDEALADRVLNRLAPGILIQGEEDMGWSLEERMEFAGAPGVSVAYVDPSGVAWARGVGTRRAGTEAPLSPDTRFQVKSLSKAVTAFAALRLVDAGRLDMDAPLNTYLKRWKIPENEYTAQVQPTLRQLLSHRAGFTVWGVPSYRPGEPIPTLVQALEGTPPADPEPVIIDYVPGTRSRYSGGGYSVLQLLLEDVTGQAFPDAMRTLVLEPLGMERSLFYEGVPDSLADQTAVGHDADGAPIDGGWEILVQMAAGGLITTAPDMGRFVLEIVRAYRGESDLLSREGAREMLQDQGDGWGLGVEVAGEGADLHFSHTGAGDGFRTLFVGVPDRMGGLVVLVNADGTRQAEIRNELVHAAALTYDWPALKPDLRPNVALDPEWYDAAVGDYRYSDGSMTHVVRTDRGLSAGWGSAIPDPIFPLDSLTYFNRAGQGFSFLMENGVITGVEWSGDFGAFRAARVP